MSNVSTFGFADNGALTGRGGDHKPLSSLSLGSMAGVVMNAQHSEDNVEQLSSRTAAGASSYPYTKHPESSEQNPVGHEQLLVNSSAYENVPATDNTESQVAHARSNSQSPHAIAMDASSSLSATTLLAEPDSAQVTPPAPARINGVGDSTAQSPLRERRGERLARGSDVQFTRQTQSRNRPKDGHSVAAFMDRRMHSAGNSTRADGAPESHHEESMRRSVHRLISATTRFDSVTNGALSLMADVARLYLMRIGEASRARADLASRTEPNLYDVCDAAALDLNASWASLSSWVDDWKADVGSLLPSTNTGCNRTEDKGGSSTAPVETRHIISAGSEWLACPKRCNSWDGQAHDTVTDDETLLPRRMSAGDFCEIPPSEERSSAAQPGLSKKDDADDDIDSMLDGLNLGCLLLHDMDECIADDIAGAIPPHLPPLVSLAEPSEEENIADLSVNDKQPTFNATIASTVTSSIVIETAEPENVAEGSPENTRAQVLQVAMSSLAELDPEIVKDKPLYAFYRQDTKFDATCAPDEALPDFEIPEDAYDSSVEVIARQLAKVDKIKPGQPMFLQGNSTQRNVLGDLEEQWRQARYSQLEDIDDSVAVLALQEMESSSTPLRPQRLDDSEDSLHIDYSADTHRDDSHVDTDIDMEQQEIQCSDIGLAEDVLDMDMDVDMDLDILGILPDDQEMDGSRHGTDIDEPLLESSTLDTQDHLEPAKEDVEEPLVPVDLPISSGLRGTDREHWAHEWLTPEMKDRLCRMSADDIVPCDSLFLDDPWITNRNAIDDIARAFVDSEGGGHLHEAMPSEKLGPHGRKAPGSSVSALRWTLHQAMQTRGASSTESLYTGRSSLAGGVAGDGVDQYISRMFSLIRPSAEEEAEQVVSGALSAAKDKEAGASGDSRKAAPEQDKLMVQLIAGAEKRVPWSQNKLDIHVIESNIANRVPQKAEVSQPVLPTSLADMPLASRLSFHPASSPMPQSPMPQSPMPQSPMQQPQKPQLTAPPSPQPAHLPEPAPQPAFASEQHENGLGGGAATPHSHAASQDL